MIKNLMVALLAALALTACNKSDDKAAASGGSTPPAGLSQLGGHSGPNNK